MPFAKGQANANPSGFNGKRMIGRPVINDLRQLMGNKFDAIEEIELEEIGHRSFSTDIASAANPQSIAFEGNES